LPVDNGIWKDGGTEQVYPMDSGETASVRT